jgi:hypothetical protein
MIEEKEPDFKGMIASLAVAMIELNKDIRRLQSQIERIDTLSARVSALENFAKNQTLDE